MQADRVELSWDPAKSSWLLRIVSGEEVIRRHCPLPQNAAPEALRSAAQQTLRDEGYEPDVSTVNINR